MQRWSMKISDRVPRFVDFFPMELQPQKCKIEATGTQNSQEENDISLAEAYLVLKESFAI